MSTPLSDSYHEEVDLEIGGRLPLPEHFEDSLLGTLVLQGRTLRALEPADHVLHWYPLKVLVFGVNLYSDGRMIYWPRATPACLTAGWGNLGRTVAAPTPEKLPELVLLEVRELTGIEKGAAALRA